MIKKTAHYQWKSQTKTPTKTGKPLDKYSKKQRLKNAYDLPAIEKIPGYPDDS